MPAERLPGFAPHALRGMFFDLDDTLLDTAGQLVGLALRAAACRMTEAGLIADPEEVTSFLQAQAGQARGVDYFGAAADHFGISAARRGIVVEAGRRAFFARDIPEIHPLPGCRSLLRRLRDRHPLFLVTAGDPATQRAKVERLRLADAFDDCAWVDSLSGHTKLDAFRELLRRHRLEPRHCACVGDRVVGEIRDGNRLGMWTIQVRRGEFAAVEPTSREEIPDFTVTDLLQLGSLLAIETFVDDACS